LLFVHRRSGAVRAQITHRTADGVCYVKNGTATSGCHGRGADNHSVAMRPRSADRRPKRRRDHRQRRSSNARRSAADGWLTYVSFLFFSFRRMPADTRRIKS
jgi:hypothetical protein